VRASDASEAARLGQNVTSRPAADPAAEFADARAAVATVARTIANAAANARADGEPSGQRRSNEATARAAGESDRQQQRAERKRMKREAAERIARRAADDGKRLLSHAPAATAAAATIAANAKAAAAKPQSSGVTESAARFPVALRRLAARALDSASLGMLGAALLWGAVNRVLANVDGSVAYMPPMFLALVFGSLFAVLPFEWIALAFFGRTPGKALFGLSVERRSGGGPGLVLAARRCREVLVRGLGLGIPVVTPFTILGSGARFINQGSTSWDDRLGLVTRAEPLDGRRVQIALGVLVGAWFVLSSQQFSELLTRLTLLSWAWLTPG
jgi:uncharacterized RDD family membrane protein YckC